METSIEISMLVSDIPWGGIIYDEVNILWKDLPNGGKGYLFSKNTSLSLIERFKKDPNVNITDNDRVWFNNPIIDTV